MNLTCHQCLCISIPSFAAFNWYPNNTCQLFYTFPVNYKIQVTQQARLYFPQRIFPNVSQCCMPNTSSLLNQINTTTQISASVLSPRCLVFDNHDYLVTISVTSRSIVRFNADNLTLITQPSSPQFSSSPKTIAYYDEAYYVGFDYNILIIDSNNLTILNNITTSLLSGTRDMIFLNDGQIMVVASTINGFLLFFNRSDNISRNYNFLSQQSVSYTNPHGLLYINDTFFYATSWGNNSIYSYSVVKNSTTWTEKLIVNAWPSTGGSNGNHVKVDECGRYWFALGSYGIQIFDGQGLLLGTITQTNSTFFDAVITDDYVIYLSDIQLNKIIRIDLNIQCWSV